MSEQKTYHSPFKRICITDQGGKKIKELQESFDKFWKQVNRVADKSPEKYHAMKSMQEACMWLTRACALKNERPYESVIDDVLKPEVESLGQLKEGQVIKNTPRIVIKTRKI